MYQGAVSAVVIFTVSFSFRPCITAGGSTEGKQLAWAGIEKSYNNSNIMIKWVHDCKWLYEHNLKKFLTICAYM